MQEQNSHYTSTINKGSVTSSSVTANMSDSDDDYFKKRLVNMIKPENYFISLHLNTFMDCYVIILPILTLLNI